jgi:hypothetical protein
MSNETIKLLAVYIEMEKNHRSNAELLGKVVLDWQEYPIIHNTLLTQIKLELEQADALHTSVFNITKSMAGQ